MKVSPTPLVLGARHAEVVQSAIKHWAESDTISPNQASLLADSIVVQSFDWEKFAKYTLRLAVLFLVVAVSSVVFEDRFLRVYRHLVALPAWLRSVATGAIAVGVHIFAYGRSQRLPGQKYRNEAIHAVGALFFALAALQLLEQLKAWFDRADKTEESAGTIQSDEEGKGDEKARERKDREMKQRQRLEHNAWLCVALGLGTVYGAVGLLSKSNLIWSCSMIVLGYCCGAATAYL